MRPARAVETNEPCPECKGTGHSGNLADETCSLCDGGGRAWAATYHPRIVRDSDDDLPSHALAERQWQDDLRAQREQQAHDRWTDTDREWP